MFSSSRFSTGYGKGSAFNQGHEINVVLGNTDVKKPPQPPPSDKKPKVVDVDVDVEEEGEGEEEEDEEVRRPDSQVNKQMLPSVDLSHFAAIAPSMDVRVIKGARHVVEETGGLKGAIESRWRRADMLDQITPEGTAVNRDMHDLHEAFHDALIERHGDCILRFVGHVAGQRYNTGDSRLFFKKNPYFLRAIDRGGSIKKLVPIVVSSTMTTPSPPTMPEPVPRSGRRLGPPIPKKNDDDNVKMQARQRAFTSNPWDVMQEFCVDTLVSNMRRSWDEMVAPFIHQGLTQNTVLRHPEGWKYWASWTVQIMREKETLNASGVDGYVRDALVRERFENETQIKRRLKQYGWWNDARAAAYLKETRG